MTREHREVIEGRLDPDEVAVVFDLVDAATRADGVRPLSEHALLHLRYGGERPARNVLLYDAAGTLVGYGHLDPTDPVEGPSGELVIHPDHRRRGHGRALAEVMLASAPGGRLRLWAHGRRPAAVALARALGFVEVRALWLMRRSLAAPLPPVALPAGIRVRTFEVGRDEEEWTRLNRRAFARHPEQGAWSLEDLRRREKEPWFDPAGFFLAERDGRLVGFHWTKIHGGDGDRHGHRPIGEVYVVGVDPQARGGGLGRALTLVGLHHLRDRGLAQAMLYVDEANTPAIRLYESLGFVHEDTDVMYRR